MRLSRTILPVAAVLLLLAGGLPAPAAAATVEDAVRFEEVFFGYGSTSLGAQRWGEVTVDKDVLIAATGIRNGVLNVVTPSGGWVVRDLPVLDAPARTREARSVSTFFDLGPPVDGSGGYFDALVTYTAAARGAPPSGDYVKFPLGATVVNAAGGSNPGDVGPIVTGSPPKLDAIGTQESKGLAPMLRSQSWVQPHDVNVQSAHNQCYPMALANAFQYLDDNTSGHVLGGFGVDHPHQIGLKGDDTLVGQLDTYVGRHVIDRHHGGGSGGIDGPMMYLSDHATTRDLESRGQPGSGSYTKGNVTMDLSAPITWTSMCDEIKAGAAVVISYGWFNSAGDRTGGHVVRVYGCGISGGKPWIAYLHDETQSNETADPDDTKGLKWVTEFIGDTDGNGLWNLAGTNREIDMVLSFRYHDKPPVLWPVERRFDALFEQVTGLRR